MALYTESADPNLYSLTNDLVGDAKVLNTINIGVSPIVNRMLSKAETFSPVSHRLAVKKSKSSNMGGFAGMQTFSTALQDTRIQSRFEPRSLYASIPISGLERDINSLQGAQGLSYVATETGSTAEDFAELISSEIYQDGTTYGSTGLIGLGLAVDSTGTFAGISRSTYSTWAASEYDISASSHATSISNSDNGFNIFRRMLMGGTDSAGNVVTATVYGSQVPTLIVTTKSLWSSLEALYSQTITGSAIGQGLVSIYQGNVGKTKIDRYAANVAPVDALQGQQGMQAITFMGIPIIWDENCPSGTMWFLNENTIQWAGVPSYEDGAVNYDLLKGPVKFEGANSMVNASIGVKRLQSRLPFAQYGEASYFLFHGALIVNPKFNGKVTGLTV